MTREEGGWTREGEGPSLRRLPLGSPSRLPRPPPASLTLLPWVLVAGLIVINWLEQISCHGCQDLRVGDELVVGAVDVAPVDVAASTAAAASGRRWWRVACRGRLRCRASAPASASASAPAFAWASPPAAAPVSVRSAPASVRLANAVVAAAAFAQLPDILEAGSMLHGRGLERREAPP